MLRQAGAPVAAEETAKEGGGEWMLTSEELDRLLTDPKYKYKVKGVRRDEAKNASEGAGAKVSGAEAARAPNQGSTETRASADGQEEQERQEQQEQRPKSHQMTSRTYFKDMQQFLYNCRYDKRLQPRTQLVYRVLADLANKHFWTYPFAVSELDLKAITHINSNDDLRKAKQALKNMGYIDFYGKPSNYTIYSPRVYQPVKEPVQSGTPSPQTP